MKLSVIISSIFVFLFVVLTRLLTFLLFKLFIWLPSSEAFVYRLSNFYYTVSPLFLILNFLVGTVITINVFLNYGKRNISQVIVFAFFNYSLGLIGELFYLFLEYTRKNLLLNLIEFYSIFFSLTPIVFLIAFFITVGGFFAEILIIRYPKYAEYVRDATLQIYNNCKNILLKFKDEQTKSELLIIIILFIISIIPRLLFQKGIYDIDDVFYLNNALLITENSFRYLLQSDIEHFWFYPVGYSLYLAGFFLIIGASGELPAGVLNAILGSISVLVMYWITKNTTTCRNTAIISALFLSFQTMHLLISITILSDILGFLLLISSILMLLKILDEKKSWHFYLFYVFVGLGTSVRYPNLIIFPLFVIVSIFTKNGFRKLLLRKENFIGILIVLLMMLPQILYNTIHYGGPLITGYHIYLTGGRSPFSWQFDVAVDSLPILVLFYLYYLLSFRFISPILTPLYIFGFYRLFRDKEEKVRILVLWILIFFCFFAFYYPGGSYPRYALYFFPPLLIFGSYGLTQMYDWQFLSEKVGSLRLAIPGIILITIFIQLVYFSILNIWRFVYASGKPLYILNSFTYYPFDFITILWIENIFALIGGVVLMFLLIKTNPFNKLFLKYDNKHAE
jgi:4-amino-4-deoxy-L-arabinose transferase-like glycosyltransferase